MNIKECLDMAQVSLMAADDAFVSETQRLICVGRSISLHLRALVIDSTMESAKDLLPHVRMALDHCYGEHSIKRMLPAPMGVFIVMHSAEKAIQHHRYAPSTREIWTALMPFVEAGWDIQVRVEDVAGNLLNCGQHVIHNIGPLQICWDCMRRL